MKIDFRASFHDVSRLLERTPRARKEGTPRGGFDQLIRDLGPPSVQPPEPKGVSLKGVTPIEPILQGMMARLKPPVLDRAAPTTEESPQLHPSPVVNEVDQGVKKPTVVSVRRISSPTNPINPPSPAQNGDLHAIHALVQAAGKKHGVDPVLGMAVISAESAFDPHAVSRDGYYSKGLFQLKDGTGQHLLDRFDLNEPYDPFNPNLNVELGVGYLRHLHDIFGKEVPLPNGVSTIAAANSAALEKLAVAAFNAGEGRVASAQQRAQRLGKNASHYEAVEPYLPEITREYVRRVIDSKSQFSDPPAP